MTKDYKNSDYKKSFKPVLKVNRILQMQRENPNMVYAGVRIDDRFDPDGTVLEEYLNNNWQFVVDEQAIENDYDNNTSKSREESYKPVPVTRKGRGGAEFVYLCKTKEQFHEDEKARVARDQARFYDSSDGRTVKRSGNNVSITDSEVNEKNAKSND